MTKFIYKAKHGPTKIIDGIIEADTFDNAVGKIIGMGFTPVDVISEEEAAFEGVEPVPLAPKIRHAKATPALRRVSVLDVALFTRQIGDMIDASVPMLKALTTVSQQTQNTQLKEIVSQMSLSVKDGSSFSEALSKYPSLFSSLYVNMVKAGEVSGKLDLILNRLADYLEAEYEIKSKVRSSLAYPFLIMGIGIVTIFVLMTFVIPKISVMFEDLNQSLPMPTIVLMNTSHFLAQYWFLMLGILIFFTGYFKRILNTPLGRRRFDEWKLKIPVMGNFIRTVEVARFARTLGTLLESGVTITTALKSVWAIADNAVIQEEGRKISEEVNNGAGLTEAMKNSPFFPAMAVNMVSVGEETGKLERGLYKIADTYEHQADRMTKTLLSLLGPLVLVFVVSLVGVVVVSMLLPILQMNLIIQ